MSLCEVSFGDSSDDADPVDFFNVRTVKARKPHACTHCAGTIEAGESHTYVAFKFEGAFDTERVCAPCHEASTEFEYHIFGGDLWRMFNEEWDNGAHVQACINRLSTARAKEHMRQQWLKWLERERVAAKRVAAMRKGKRTP